MNKLLFDSLRGVKLQNNSAKSFCTKNCTCCQKIGFEGCAIFSGGNANPPQNNPPNFCFQKVIFFTKLSEINGFSDVHEENESFTVDLF
jgi:hypothetical protein